MASSSAPSQLLLKIISAATAPHQSHRLFVGPTRPTSLLLPSVTQPRPLLAFSRRRNSSSSATTPSSKEKKKLRQNDDEVEGDLDEDAIEALFSQLEEDLKNNEMSAFDGDDEISEEDLARLEQELEDSFGDGFDDEPSGASDSNTDVVGSEDDDDEEEPPLKLKNWQLRRLASALKIGRRKTSIKSLAAELGLDRAVVLELLRELPPNLLLMCASLPDKVISAPEEPPSPQPESEPVESSPLLVDVKECEPVVKAPVHVMRSRWSSQKRLKKVQLETLERVYCRTKRPTNTMISSIVHVTNLPWKTVVKWFEDKRLKDGVPDQRQPFRRSTPETVSTN
ncbi:protein OVEREXPRESSOR OF CATIONIC PEROXIDASE 3 [Magnolia sinica]|uniref:protein OVEREXPRESSOR OF CATIONIC PEROXIDASE 3 n=1 Tax=Magnolia sinica TaxID=86752 RepID=UPI002658818E|nr:protein OVEREXPRESSOR OF CATIONIC PEROXIDASE 3 [Magnolia sinica]XP_058074523.1 protein OVEREXPRESSOR OF CATIONIC PEROXIDASE 3 [Magnolia sinica]XP_058074524.1 protein OVEREXPRESSOR OF CATIONIC PEROXIDASE 3 [Magnolia sinica]XP_058074525.1 protein OVEREXPRESSOR OF CATIONIC PEROXIDASE 3 [Magnolia sinica]